MLDRNTLHKKYVVEQLSTCSIGKEFNIHPNTVRRALIKFGFKIRDKSQAQSLALAEGRAEHPSKGKIMPPEKRRALSNALAEAWANKTEEEIQQFKQQRIDAWANMSDEEKQAIKEKSKKGIRKASTKGSSVEHFVRDQLISKNYNVVCHEKAATPGGKLEVDMLLPKEHIVVEIDGPSHFLPIWGEEALEKTQYSDGIKNGLLLSAGYVVIRVGFKFKHTSQHRKNKIANVVLETIRSVKNKWPSPDERLIKLEVE